MEQYPMSRFFFKIALVVLIIMTAMTIYSMIKFNNYANIFVIILMLAFIIISALIVKKLDELQHKDMWDI